MLTIKDGIVYNAEGTRVGKLVNGEFKPNAVYDPKRDGELVIPEKPKEQDERIAEA